MTLKVKVATGLYLVLLCGYANAEWETFANTRNGMVYYDTDRVIQLPDKKTSVWMKFHIGQAGVKDGLSFNSGFKRYDYSVANEIFDCNARKSRLVALQHYDNSEKPFLSYTYPLGETAFANIIPDSLLDKLAQIVCRE